MRIRVRCTGASRILVGLGCLILASCTPAPVKPDPPPVVHRNRVMPGLRLNILQPRQGASPDQPRYSIPWPRDEQGQPLAGTSTVLLHVDALGRVASATLDKSSGHKELDTAVLDAVRQWHLAPAHEGGVPVESVLRIPITMDPNNPWAGIQMSLPLIPSS